MKKKSKLALFLAWKEKNNYTYKDIGEIFESNISTLNQFAKGYRKLSFKLYNEMKDNNIL